MPLAFDSRSHGQIAFGFFNIESDLLLLEHYFFFATDFCRHISTVATTDTDQSQDWAVFDITDRSAIGDLMGAIHGIRFTGFIGEVYRRFPFPADPRGFKQNPEGVQTQATLREIIASYAQEEPLSVTMDATRLVVGIGEYQFDRRVFQALVNYVWQGGYPRWRNASPPPYVVEMKEQVQDSPHPLFHGMSF